MHRYQMRLRHCCVVDVSTSPVWIFGFDGGSRPPEVGHLQLQATIPFFFCLLLFCLLIYFSIYIDASSTYWKVMIMMEREQSLIG
jgi:hypothetical protein